jgi:hypothetical protein
MTETQLLELKKKVDAAKTTVSELEGEQKALMKQLKEDWQCVTIEQAEKKVKTMNEEIETLSTQIKEGIAELEETYQIEE